MHSQATFISYLRLALLVCTFVVGTAIVHAQTINTVAGNGFAGYSGDGALSGTSALNRPRGVSFDTSGNVYIADEMNHRIRRISVTNQTITTVAGNGLAGFSGDGGAAVNAQLNQPEDVVVDSSGNIYIADSNNHRIRKITPDGIISTFAGTGTFGFNSDSIAAVNAQLNRPTSIAFDVSGNLYIADSSNQRVRKVTNGIITTVAGNGAQGYSGNSGLATAATLRFPVGVAVDSAGNLFIADAGNHVLRKVTPSNGFIFTVAGNGNGAGTDTGSFSGDGGLATAAGLNTPEDIAVDPAGNLYIADTANNRIRKMNASNNVITTFAGTGTDGFSGDGGLATQATLNFPWAVSLDAAGNLFISDLQNQRIRKVTLGSGTTDPPNVNEGGIMNSASYNIASLALAPGTITVVFGTNLTNGISCISSGCASYGSDGKLGTTMAGAQVRINGTPVPMYYATPNQLAIQFPTEISGTSATLQVTVGGQSSSPRSITVDAVSPGIFAFNAQGSGAGAITHADAVGTSISPQNPARPGEIVIIYATGLGQVSPFVPTGMRPSGVARTVAPVLVTIDGIAVIPEFAGLSGCCAGLNQINVKIPLNTRSGNGIPVFLSINGKQSNTVTIAVQP